MSRRGWIWTACILATSWPALGMQDPPKATDGGAKKAESPTPPTPPAPEPPPLRGWAQELDRAGTRLIYFHETKPTPWDRSPGQVAITYGRLPWKEVYATSMERLQKRAGAAPATQRWRLGKDLWTTLDARVPVTIGETRIPPGYYYVILELDQSGPDDRFQLCCVDPATVTSQELDAWHADKKDVPVTLRVSMILSKREEPAEELGIRFVMDKKAPRSAKLHIDFGPYQLSAPVTVDVK